MPFPLVILVVRQNGTNGQRNQTTANYRTTTLRAFASKTGLLCIPTHVGDAAMLLLFAIMILRARFDQGDFVGA